jgi:hypothetical protein
MDRIESAEIQNAGARKIFDRMNRMNADLIAARKRKERRIRILTG